MPSRPRLLTLICATAATAATASLALLPAAATASPQTGMQQWIDCAPGHIGGALPYTIWPDLWKAQRSGDRETAALLEKIAHVPQAKWLAGSGVRDEPARIVGAYVTNMIASEWGGPSCLTKRRSRREPQSPYVGSYPVFALRQLPHDACHRGYDGGGSWNRVRGGSYLPWLEKVLTALRPIDHRATIIVEPDGLPVIEKCLSRGAIKQRFGLMRAVNKRLGSVPNLTTYIDIGSSGWLRKGQAKSYLRRAGVRYIRGFALNTTHFNYTRQEVRYGNALGRTLGKHYVVNTAENGRGGLKIKNPNKQNIKNRFCNPTNAGLGPLPTTKTASKLADAYLWISRPGMSSNGHSGQSQCSRGPGGNVFWMPKALQEARKAIFREAPWPPAPL